MLARLMRKFVHYTVHWLSCCGGVDGESVHFREALSYRENQFFYYATGSEAALSLSKGRGGRVPTFSTYYSTFQERT